MIRLARPWIDEAECEALLRVARSERLVQGDEVAAFEDAVARRLHAAMPKTLPVMAHAVANGTVALEVALLAAGVGPGDEVIVPALTWPSPGNAVVLRGAVPVLVDVEPATFNIDPMRVAELITPRTRAVIAIDQFGVPARIRELRSIVGDALIVEDSACALGSSLDGVPCGLLGDIGCFSFHPRKVITTGEGGMLVTTDRRMSSSIRAIRNHGQDTPGSFRCAGPNARMAEFAAAVGRTQMDKLDRILARRRAISQEIRGAVSLAWQSVPEGAETNHQTLGFVLPDPERGSLLEARNALLAALRGDQIEAAILSYGLHRLPQFAAFAANVSRGFGAAERIADGGIAVPLHPLLERTEVDRIVDALRRHGSWALGRSV